MGTKKNPGTFDCYSNADPDEPMFVLLGRDPVAGALVRLWVQERTAKQMTEGTYTHEDAEKFQEALKCADAMDAWAVSKGKLPLFLRLQASKTAAVETIAQASALLVHLLTTEERQGVEDPPGLLERIRRLPTPR